jgi:hypothetical protein
MWRGAAHRHICGLYLETPGRFLVTVMIQELKIELAPGLLFLNRYFLYSRHSFNCILSLGGPHLPAAQPSDAFLTSLLSVLTDMIVRLR